MIAIREHMDTLMSQDTAALRTTQRAPKSCVSCKARKVRCDRNIPCKQCVRRGTASDCTREVVVVRGKIVV